MTVFAVVFVTLMIAWPMTTRTVAAQNYVDDIAGYSYSYDTYYEYGEASGSKVPSYMECLHTDLYSSYDMMVGLGLYTFYEDFNHYNLWKLLV